MLISDLTYVRANSKWNYICLFIDIFNKQIVGYSVGRKKNAELVYKALDVFQIKRSLSRKGNPYDNAVAESTFKIFKTEFINSSIFSSLNELEVELADYINWF